MPPTTRARQLLADRRPTRRAATSGPATPRHAAPGDLFAAAGQAAKGVGVPLVAAAVVSAGAPGWTTYTIQRGDTVSEIAKRHGTTTRALVEANDLAGGGHRILAGRTMQVPGSGSGAVSGAASGAAPAVAAVHTVAAGENLTVIARRHGSTVRKIMEANGLTSTVIHPGQRLTLGTVATAPTATAPTTSSGAGTGTSPATSANTFAGRTYPDAVVAAAARNREILASRSLPTREQIRDMITATARQYGVDPSLALAISWQESGWRHDRVSVANAIGAMQVVPSTGRWISGVVGRDLDLLDPQDNITAGVALLQVLTRQADEADAIAGYYQGLASVRRNGMWTDTRQYVDNVLALRPRFR